jgi:threonine synthase
MTTLTHLECTRCARRFEAGRVWNLCDCGGPLAARYDLDRARQSWNRDWISNGPSSIWRYAPVLPVSKPAAMVTLGEGMTPLIRLPRLGERAGLSDLWLKDDGVNPTGAFKARGLACAVSMAVELGIGEVALPSAGNAASALAAYAAAAGVKAHIFLPRDVPQSNYVECRSFGAEVTLVDGLIGDCARLAREGCARHGWFDMSTLAEPYRVEGKKTMGYELAEQFRWSLPDAVLYPTGGGVGLIGMWKAFAELETLDWVAGKPPRMIAVQVEGCQPVVRAFEQGRTECEPWQNAWTVAAGLRVPNPLGGPMILDALRASGGTAVSVSDQAALDAGIDLASLEGIFVAPEGAACVAALPKLVASGALKAGERVVVYNTGAGLKYLEAYSTRFPRGAAGEQDKLGGLITPRWAARRLLAQPAVDVGFDLRQHRRIAEQVARSEVGVVLVEQVDRAQRHSVGQRGVPGAHPRPVLADAIQPRHHAAFQRGVNHRFRGGGEPVAGEPLGKALVQPCREVPQSGDAGVNDLVRESAARGGARRGLDHRHADAPVVLAAAPFGGVGGAAVGIQRLNDGRQPLLDPASQLVGDARVLLFQHRQDGAGRLRVEFGLVVAQHEAGAELAAAAGIPLSFALGALEETLDGGVVLLCEGLLPILDRAAHVVASIGGQSGHGQQPGMPAMKLNQGLQPR